MTVLRACVWRGFAVVSLMLGRSTTARADGAFKYGGAAYSALPIRSKEKTANACAAAPLHVVPECQLFRVRLEVGLAREVFDPTRAHVMANERQRDD